LYDKAAGRAWGCNVGEKQRIYLLICRNFCRWPSIPDFEPPHAAVFVAVFFMQVSANKKKSYKSAKF